MIDDLLGDDDQQRICGALEVVAFVDHRLPHEGRPVAAGHKLVLRNDVVARAPAFAG